MDIYLVRHGLTQFNEELRYIGRTDQPLTGRGREQAEAISKRLAGFTFDNIYSSPKNRAIQTAEAITRMNGHDICVVPEFDEIDFGDLEGLTFAEIQERFPVFHRAWTVDPSKTQIPGGEPWDDFIARVGCGINSVIQENLESQNILIVAHGGTFRGVLIALGIVYPDQFLKMTIMHASLSRINTDGKHHILYTLNDMSHLDGTGVRT